MRGCLRWLDEAALGAAKAAPTRPGPRGGRSGRPAGFTPRAPLGSTVPGSKNAAVECREARRSNRRRRLARPWLAPSGAPPLLARSGGTGDLAKSGAVRRAETNPHTLGDLRHDRPRPRCRHARCACRHSAAADRWTGDPRGDVAHHSDRRRATSPATGANARGGAAGASNAAWRRRRNAWPRRARRSPISRRRTPGSPRACASSLLDILLARVLGAKETEREAPGETAHA